MPDLAVIKSLIEAGGWTLFVLTVIVIAIGVRLKWWVPGWIYLDERARSDRLEGAMDRLTRTVESVADDIVWNAGDRHIARRRGRDA